MARFLVDVPEEDVIRLDALAKAEGKSRAAVLREAVANYIAAESRQGFERYFGLWNGTVRPSMALNMRASCAVSGLMYLIWRPRKRSIKRRE